MPSKYTTAERREAVRRYLAGETTRELARAYGVHHTCISKWVTKYGKPRRCGHPAKPLPKLKELWALREQLGTWDSVARRFGVAEATVLRRANAQVVP